jgi:hypothetical protein
MWGKKLSEFKPEKEDAGTVTIKELIHGKAPSSGIIKKNRFYLLFLVFLALIYINNNFVVESLMKEQLNITKEIKELKFEAITTSSELMKKSRQSEVIRKVQENNLGLEALTTPPKTIIVKEK